MSGLRDELGVISRLLSDVAEELKELEDEEAMAKGRKDDAVAIGSRKEMDARCVDARLCRGWRGYESTP
jgi:hypothetical protein